VLKNIITLKHSLGSGQFLAHSFYLGESVADVVGQIERLLGPILASLGLALWELEFRKEGPRWMLRVFIDREEGGVTLNDCEAVSRDLSAALDVEDVIPQAYTLEVSSPGLDRTLTKPEHFSRFIGSAVKIKTFQPIEGQKVFHGTLKGMEGGIVKMELPGGAVLDIPLGDISKASLEVAF
jgi:ribosome maturation factor RimP